MCSEVHNEPLVRGRLNHPGAAETLNGSAARGDGGVNGAIRVAQNVQGRAAEHRGGDWCEIGALTSTQKDKVEGHAKQPRRCSTKESFEMFRTFHRKHQGQKINSSTK